MAVVDHVGATSTTGNADGRSSYSWFGSKSPAYCKCKRARAIDRAMCQFEFGVHAAWSQSVRVTRWSRSLECSSNRVILVQNNRDNFY